MPLIPSDITKNKRSQYQKFLDTTPSSNSPLWKVIGIGISEASVSYNPQVNTEQWIIEDSARNDHTGNQKQLSVTQRCYKGDPEFEFINSGRDKMNYVSHILEVDTWNGTGTTTVSYPAKMSDCLITITSYSGEKIEYTIYFNRRPKRGYSNNRRRCSNIYTNSSVNEIKRDWEHTQSLKFYGGYYGLHTIKT